MTGLAPILQGFFTTRLCDQYGASEHTIAAYRDTWRLLLRYAATATGTAPAALDLSQLDTDLITEFLAHLETERGNTVSTRNARLAAVHSLFSYAAYQHPEHADTISRVLAIPAKRAQRTEITYLTPPEVIALLHAPDRSTTAGRRDHALIQVAVTTGMRVSELTALTVGDVHLGTGAHVVCHGKGRKDRITPLDRQTVQVLRHLTARASADAFVFPAREGTRMSHDAVAARLALHTATAADACPSLTRKNVTAHVLRHYVDGWVMWLVGCFRWWERRWNRFRPHNPERVGQRPRWSTRLIRCAFSAVWGDPRLFPTRRLWLSP